MSIFHVRSFLGGAAFLAATLCVSGCSEEKKEPLPDLPAIELPKDVPALYSGVLPCDDCKMKLARMTLNEDMSVVTEQTVIKDNSTIVDTLRGTYEVTDSTIKVSLSDNTIHWNFKRIESGNLSYMTSAGTVYEDENGMTADFIKIYKKAIELRKPAGDAPSAESSVDSSKSPVKE